MKPIRIFEYAIADWLPSSQDLSRIERLNTSLRDEVLSIRVERGKPVVKATSYVGILKIGKTTIEVLPKVDNANENLATRNLLYLLSYTKKLQIKESEIAHLTERQSEFFEILIYLFANNLWDLMKKGVYKEYVTKEEYAGFLKGKWLISQQLIQKPTEKHSFYISYDDFTDDNSFNRIFKYTVALLQKISTNSSNQQLLMELSFAFNDIAFEVITKEHFQSLNVNRLNRQYLPVLELARLFILNSSLQMTAKDIETFSFVFDMNRLFEEFIFEFIRKHRDAILSDELQDCEIRPQFGDIFLVYAEDGRRVFRLRPDIVFIKPNKTIPILIDTKYKLLNSQDKELGISQSDMYQMFAYSEKYSCNKVIMIYPDRGEVKEKTFTVEEGENRKIRINTVDIGIDLFKNKEALLGQLKKIFGGQNASLDS